MDVSTTDFVKLVPTETKEPRFFLASLYDMANERTPAEVDPKLFYYINQVAPGILGGMMSQEELEELQQQDFSSMQQLILSEIQSNYRVFTSRLYQELGVAQTGDFLEAIGVPEEIIMRTLDMAGQTERVYKNIVDVFPDMKNVEQFYE